VHHPTTLLHIGAVEEALARAEQARSEAAGRAEEAKAANCQRLRERSAERAMDCMETVDLGADPAICERRCRSRIPGCD
jgi:hypothetical protein